MVVLGGSRQVETVHKVSPSELIFTIRCHPVISLHRGVVKRHIGVGHFTKLFVLCMSIKLLSTSWFNTMHILTQPSYIPICSGGGHYHHQGTQYHRPKNTAIWRCQSCHALTHLFRVPRQHRAVYVTPPMYVWSLVYFTWWWWWPSPKHVGKLLDCISTRIFILLDHMVDKTWYGHVLFIWKTGMPLPSNASQFSLTYWIFAILYSLLQTITC